MPEKVKTGGQSSSAMYGRRLALVMLLATGCSSGTESGPAEAFVPLVTSLANRLATADQVALAKWDTGQPVFDPQRESTVISAAVQLAPQYGLGAADVTLVFQDQIEANKEVQYALLGNWRRLGSAPSAPRESLTDTIRPLLDQLQLSILQGIQEVSAARGTPGCASAVAVAVGKVAQQDALDTLHLAALDRAVASICTASQAQGAGGAAAPSR